MLCEEICITWAILELEGENIYIQIGQNFERISIEVSKWLKNVSHFQYDFGSQISQTGNLEYQIY